MRELYTLLRKYLRPLKKFFLNLIKIFSKIFLILIPNYILDYVLERRCKCSYKNDFFFVRNFNSLCRFRASTFATKEPDTLDWISSFQKNAIFLDIGANIGIYSIFAAKFTKKIYSFEPDALNYALLNLNIKDNSLDEKISAYPVSIHNSFKFDYLNLQNYQFGGALSSFSNNKDQFEKRFNPSFRQGSYSITIDYFISNLEIKIKENLYCKIDVDGNEKIVLDGAKKTLKNKIFKSILVELDSTRTDYKKVMSIFKKNGYALISKKSSPIFQSIFGTTMNHIFELK